MGRVQVRDLTIQHNIQFLTIVGIFLFVARFLLGGGGDFRIIDVELKKAGGNFHHLNLNQEVVG